ncbi:MAG: hypothetical protein AAGI03_07785 [Pseudomonadota bacterium]
MIRLEREYNRFGQSLCRSADGRSIGGSPERPAAEVGTVDPAVERLLDMNTEEGAELYRDTFEIAEAVCHKQNVAFADVSIQTYTYARQKSLLEAAIKYHKNPEYWQERETRETVLALVPHLHDLKATQKKCKQQAKTTAVGCANTAFTRKVKREASGDFEKRAEWYGGGATMANLQQEALAAEIDRPREEELSLLAEKAFDSLLDIEKHLSSKNGDERRIYMAIRLWRRGRLVMEKNNLRTGRLQDLAASHYDVSGDVMRSRSKELEAWARFFVGDQKGHASRFVAHLRNVVRNLGTRSSRHAFYHSLIAFEEAFWQDLRLSRDKARDRFQQLAFDSELNITGNPIDNFQRQRWKARMKFLDTLAADELETEQGKQ